MFGRFIRRIDAGEVFKFAARPVFRSCTMIKSRISEERNYGRADHP